jgi:hypothetical protein
MPAGLAVPLAPGALGDGVVDLLASVQVISIGVRVGNHQAGQPTTRGVFPHQEAAQSTHGRPALPANRRASSAPLNSSRSMRSTTG